VARERTARGDVCPVLEVFVDDVAAARTCLVASGARVVKDEPSFPRCYVRDRFGLVYNLARVAGTFAGKRDDP
jgi:hypothetical protein